MTDSQILDWIQEHLDGFRQTLQDNDDGDPLYEMTWIDDNGEPQVTKGNNLRHCAIIAASK